MLTPQSMVSVYQFLQVFLFSAALALSETVMGQLVTYTSGHAVGPLFGPGMFLALSAGSFLVFKKFNHFKLDMSPFLIASIMVLMSIIGFAHIPELAVLWGIIPFLAFGYILNGFYITYSLRMLLIAASTGVLSMLIVLKCFTLQTDARYYPLAIIFALLVCSIFNRPKIKNVVAVVFIAGISAAAFFAGYLNPSAGMIRNNPTLKDGTLLHPTIMTPWIYTDLVKTKEGPYIITNGAKFSKVVRAPQRPRTWRDIPTRYLDESFILSNAKSALIIGPAGGINVGRALKYGVEDIDAVDINPAVFYFMVNKVGHFTQQLYMKRKVNMIVSEGRHFLETTQKKYDVIFIQGVRTGTTFSSIDGSMLESYILTPQAIRTMWERLTDNGIIVLQDYFSPASEDDPNSSYLRNIQGQLSGYLPVTDMDKQVLFYVSNRIAPQNVDHLDRNVPNEVLLISKQPILSKEAVENVLQLKNDTLDFTPYQPQKSLLPLPITDDRPFHTTVIFQNRLLITLIVTVLGAFATILYLNSKSKALSNKSGIASGRYGFMYLSGLGFILVFMGMLGKAHMILGQPQLSSAVILFSFYLFSLPAGIWATRIKFLKTIWAMVGAIIWTGVIAIGFYLYQDELIKITPQIVQIAILVGIVAVFAALTEIPYIASLAEADHTIRGKQFAIGKLGAAIGVIIGFCIQLIFGYTAVFAAGFVFLMLSLFYYLKDASTKTMDSAVQS